jgi:hypothetical protein
LREGCILLHFWCIAGLGKAVVGSSSRARRPCYGAIQLGKNTSLYRGAVMRAGDDFLSEIVDGGQIFGVFCGVGELRFARRGRAPEWRKRRWARGLCRKYSMM